MDPYNTLNIPIDATQAEVKAAYRKAAQQSHPDRNGGDAEAFHEIMKAYDILRDPERRHRYDTEGVTEEPVPQADPAVNQLMNLFTWALDQNVKGDIIEQCRKQIHKVLGNISQERQKADAQRMRLDAKLNRITCDEETNLYEGILQSRIDKCEVQIEYCNTEQKTMERVLELLDHYEDSAPDESMINIPTGTTFTSTTTWNGSV